MEIRKPNTFINDEIEQEFDELKSRAEELHDQILSWDGENTEQIAKWINDYQEALDELESLCGEDFGHPSLYSELQELGQHPDDLEEFDFDEWYDESPIMAAGYDCKILVEEHQTNHDRVRTWEALDPSDESTWKSDD